MCVADGCPREPPVPPHARQPFIGCGVASVQRQRVIEVPVCEIQHFKLA